MSCFALYTPAVNTLHKMTQIYALNWSETSTLRYTVHLRVSTIVRFFTFAIVEIYRKWVLISRNFAEFREIPKPRNFAKVRNFDIIDVGIPRNFEISIIMISEFREISKDRCRYPQNYEISRNFDFVIIEISIFCGIPISLLSITRNCAKTRYFDHNDIRIPQKLVLLIDVIDHWY